RCTAVLQERPSPAHGARGAGGAAQPDEGDPAGGEAGGGTAPGTAVDDAVVDPADVAVDVAVGGGDGGAASAPDRNSVVAYALASSTLSRCRITRDTTPSSRLKYSSARVWTGMSRRNAPLAAPRSNTARSGAASCRSMRRASRGAFSNRPSARYRPVAAIVTRVMRATASSIGTESSRASFSRRVRSDSAASYRAYSSASRLGK